MIVAAEGIGPGVYGAFVDGQRCEGTMGLVAKRETDAIVLVGGDRCVLSVTDSHPVGGAHTGSSIAGELPQGIAGRAVVGIVSLDTPKNAVPDPVEADESGHFVFAPLQAGQYRLTLSVDGVVVSVRDVTLEAGSVEFVSLIDPA
jgi:hypothetical protein